MRTYFRSVLPPMILLSLAMALAACGGSGAGGGGGNTGGNGTPTPASVAVTPATASVAAGGTQQFAATVKDASGNAISGATVTWSASPAAVATISSSGLATAVAAGTATITAASGAISGTATLTVTPPPVASVTVAPASPTIVEGATQQFTATAKDAKGNAIAGATFTWASSAAGVASIDANGLATGKTAGTTNITASTGGVTSTADVLTVNPSATVTGTAAHGSALAGLTVTLKDAAGTARTSTTGVDGTFTVDASGLKPPYLLQVQPGTGPTVYSVSADGNTSTAINLDPLTDLIIRSWYSAQGQSIDTAFGSPTGVSAAPSPTQVQVLQGFTQNLVALWLQKNGITDPKFNLISTPFQANGSGVDKVLDETTVTPGSGSTATTVAISDGTTSQSTTVTYTTATTAVNATTTTTSGGATSTSSSSTVVPTNGGQTSALAGIQASAAAITAVFAAKGAQLADTDLLGFMTPDLMFEGLNQAQFAAMLATFARGQTASITVTALNSVDPTGGKANAHMVFQLGQAQLSKDLNFVLSSGSWLMAGEGRPEQLNFDSAFSVTQMGSVVQGRNTVNLGVKAAPGLVTAVTVSGGGLFSNTAMTQQAQQVSTYAPTPSTSLVVTLDNFNANDGGQLTGLIPAGTPFTYNVTTTSGTQSFTLNSNANTTEGTQFTGLTSSSLSSLTLGGNNTFSWTLPKTFPLASMSLKTQAFNGNPNVSTTTDCRTEQQITNLSATSGTIAIPATCQGAIVQVEVDITFQGLNGELSEVFAIFQ